MTPSYIKELLLRYVANLLSLYILLSIICLSLFPNLSFASNEQFVPNKDLSKAGRKKTRKLLSRVTFVAGHGVDVLMVQSNVHQYCLLSEIEVSAVVQTICDRFCFLDLPLNFLRLANTQNPPLSSLEAAPQKWACILAILCSTLSA